MKQNQKLWIIHRHCRKSSNRALMFQYMIFYAHITNDRFISSRRKFTANLGNENGIYKLLQNRRWIAQHAKHMIIQIYGVY